jgi:hypothetical protein
MRKLLFTILLFVTLSQVYSQSVSIDSILINGSLRRTINFKELLDTGIKIDSIVTQKIGDSYFYERALYIGQSVFLYFPKENICEATSIWFDKIKEVNIGNCLINSSTTFNDLKSYFPIDCETIKEVGIYRHDGTYQYISIPVKDKKGQLLALKINIFLKDNKVARVSFWEPM